MAKAEDSSTSAAELESTELHHGGKFERISFLSVLFFFFFSYSDDSGFVENSAVEFPPSAGILFSAAGPEMMTMMSPHAVQ